MHKKPSTEFGYIAFGKDGSVSKVSEKLSGDKIQQEREVAEAFGAALSKSNAQEVELLAPIDHSHDFRLRISAQSVEVQLTEIVQSDYVVADTSDDRSGGQPKFDDYITTPDGSLLAVDQSRLANVVVERIKLKLGKRYQKPSSGLFWLCIFTTDPRVRSTWLQRGKAMKSETIHRAEMYCASASTEPFDAVWFLSMKPSMPSLYRIWPTQPQIAEVDPNKPSGVVRVFIPASHMVTSKDRR